MTKFYGAVGFGETVEDPPDSGEYKDVITERSYSGDEIRNTRRSVEGEKVHDDQSVTVTLSILADEYALANFRNIRYVVWDGGVWKVPTKERHSPRLVLYPGEVWNGRRPVSEDNPEGED